MEQVIRIGNYLIKEPVINILSDLKQALNNGKLRDIKDKDDEIIVTCPNDNHKGGQESTPDCHINLGHNPELPFGYFNCFACEASGTFDHFVALCSSTNDLNAQTWLIQHYGEYSPNAIILGDDINIYKKKKKVRYLDPKILDQYQSWTPYLQTRNLSRKVCELFKVKYDPEYRQVIFPCFDIHGRLVMMPKRNVDNKIFYLDSGAEKPLYALDYVVNNRIKSICMVEGPIDCLTCYSNNIPAIATLGVPSTEQLELLESLNITHVCLMFDNDEYGKKFTNFVKNYLYKHARRILVDVVQLPMGKKDINDLSKDEIMSLIDKYNLPTLIK